MFSAFGVLNIITLIYIKEVSSHSAGKVTNHKRCYMQTLLNTITHTHILCANRCVPALKWLVIYVQQIFVCHNWWIREQFGWIRSLIPFRWVTNYCRQTMIKQMASISSAVSVKFCIQSWYLGNPKICTKVNEISIHFQDYFEFLWQHNSHFQAQICFNRMEIATIC